MSAANVDPGRCDGLTMLLLTVGQANFTRNYNRTCLELVVHLLCRPLQPHGILRHLQPTHSHSTSIGSLHSTAAFQQAYPSYTANPNNSTTAFSENTHNRCQQCSKSGQGHLAHKLRAIVCHRDLPQVSSYRPALLPVTVALLVQLALHNSKLAINLV